MKKILIVIGYERMHVPQLGINVAVDMRHSAINQHAIITEIVNSNQFEITLLSLNDESIFDGCKKINATSIVDLIEKFKYLTNATITNIKYDVVLSLVHMFPRRLSDIMEAYDQMPVYEHVVCKANSIATDYPASNRSVALTFDYQNILNSKWYQTILNVKQYNSTCNVIDVVTSLGHNIGDLDQEIDIVKDHINDNQLDIVFITPLSQNFDNVKKRENSVCVVGKTMGVVVNESSVPTSVMSVIHELMNLNK